MQASEYSRNQLVECSESFSPRFGLSSVNVYRGFGEVCSGTENALIECQRRGSICTADSVDHAVAIACGGSIVSLF
jgi:hypothetical protein